jgi:hypothetical protein
MTAWQLYWLTRLDGMKCLFGIAASGTGIVCVALLVGWGVCTMSGETREAGSLRGMLFRLIPVTLGFLLLQALTPSMKSMAFILVAPKLYNAVSQNKELREMPTKVVELANAWLEELRPDNAKEAKK